MTNMRYELNMLLFGSQRSEQPKNVQFKQIIQIFNNDICSWSCCYFQPFCLNKCSPNIFQILSLHPNYTFGSGQSANLPCRWLFNLQLSGVGKKESKKKSLLPLGWKPTRITRWLLSQKTVKMEALRLY